MSSRTSLNLDSELQKVHRLYASRQTNAAARKLRQLVNSYPSSIEALQLLGAVCCDLGEVKEGLRHLQRAREINPRSAPVLFNLGKAQLLNGQPGEALETFRLGLAIEPKAVPLICGVGNAHCELGNRKEGMKYYRQALAIDPKCAEAFDNLGRQFALEENPGEAVKYLRRALELDRNHGGSWFTLADALLKLKNFAEARAALKTGLDLAPTDGTALSQAMECSLRLGYWDAYGKIRAGISASVNRDEAGVDPLTVLCISDDPELHLRCAQRNQKTGLFPDTAEPASEPRRDGRKIRVGYFSADFRSHPVSYLCAGLFERHNRDAFEIIGVSINQKDDGSELGRRVRKSFDTFIDAAQLSDAELRDVARRNDIDIAIDLMGHTLNCRPTIFNSRLAPIQVNFLGYPGTIGSSNIDYIVLDSFIATHRVRESCTESVVTLPYCYQPNDDKRVLPAQPRAREQYGLPEDGFVFCCFNNHRKITPEMFDIWMNVLRAREGSVLWLAGESDAAVLGFRREAERRKIDGKRIVAAAYERHAADHLARYQVADLFLDTFPYTAHTTASDALWASCPVLTRVGESIASRVSGSLLDTMGLPELITGRAEDYQEAAIRLSSGNGELSAIRCKLAELKGTSRLFKTEPFARDFEAALLEMWRRKEAGEPPGPIALGKVM